jgi:hypothetical protein
LSGNAKLKKWTGEEWVCDRGSIENILVYGVADAIPQAMPDWRIWPETTTGEDFNWVGARHIERV